MRERRVIGAIAAGSFLTSFDASAMTATLPAIRVGLGITVAAAGWLLLAELLATTGLLMVFGRLGDRHGHKRMYLTGLVVFATGSAACIIAPNLSTLVFLRVLTGVGSAMIAAAAPALLVQHTCSGSRGRLLGLRTSLICLGLVLGPAAGGWLTARFDWHLVFLPQALAALALGCLASGFIPEDRVRRTFEGEWDLAGAVLWSGAVAMFLAALQPGIPAVAKTEGMFAAALLLMCLILAQRGNPAAIPDTALFRSRAFTLATAGLLTHFVCSYAFTFSMPFYLLEGWHLSRPGAGMSIAALALIRLAIAPFSGAWCDKYGALMPQMCGMGALGCGLLVLAQSGAPSPVAAIAGCLLAALGTGLFLPANNSMLLGEAADCQWGAASGILATSRNIGMALGVGLATSMLPAEFATVARGSGVLLRTFHAAFLFAGLLAVFCTMMFAWWYHSRRHDSFAEWAQSPEISAATPLTRVMDPATAFQSDGRQL